MERKLTAILCADVYAYSRLMGEDEEATVRTLASHRKIVDALIEQYHGRFVSSAGDSILAEFASVVNAVQCGTGIQTALAAENTKLQTGQRMQFRIGINLGDVIIDGAQIYGDGVNVAARLESLAEPGGICISDTVHAQIKNKLALAYQDLGTQRVKNIAEPVRIFRVLNESNGRLGRARKSERVGKFVRRGAFSFAGILIIIATILAVQNLSLRPPAPTASIPAPAKPVLDLPDKPSIAVLPFTNMSGDRQQEYFSDGITDDLITNLSRFPGLFVIARESTFTYKGKLAKLRDVSRELGVQYVLGGGVRKAAGQVRITVQLADATTGAQVWAERYDRPMRDVFALQDEIVRKIVTTLNLQLALSQRGVTIPRTTENLEAYDDVLRGMEFFLSLTRNDYVKAQQMFEKAIELDPKYSVAYQLLGFNYYTGWALALDPDPGSLERALHVTQQAITLEDSLGLAHSALALIYIHNGQNAHMFDRDWRDSALSEAQRGITLDPNSAFGYVALADIQNMQGKHTEALVAVDKAMRLDPRNSVDYMVLQGEAYTGLERWKEAVSPLNAYLAHYPDQIWAHALLAIIYFNLRDHDSALAETAHAERLAALNPSALTYYSLALTLSVQGKPAEALVAAERGVRFDPQNPLLLSQLGWAYSQLGRWNQALSIWKRYVALYPDDIAARASLAGQYSALGRMDDARREVARVEQAVALDPNTAYGDRYLAMALNATGRPAEALDTAEHAMRLYPASGAYPPYSLCEQGRAYTQLTRWGEAVRALNNCLARHATDQVLPRAALAVNYVELGQDDAARAEVAEILKLDPQFSLKRAVESEFPAQRELAAVDLRKAGLK